MGCPEVSTSMWLLNKENYSALMRVIINQKALTTFCALFLVFALSMTFVAFPISAVKTIEERIGALSWTFAPDTSVEERITIVAIDERSIESLGPWPWSREVMADLTNAINAAGAQLQIHDIVYPPGERAGDSLFSNALGTDGGAILAQLPILQHQDSPIRSGRLTHPMSGVSCEGASFATADSFVAASEMFLSVPKGHIAPVIDPDGAIRRVPAVICTEGQAFPALAIAPLLQLAAGADWTGSISQGSGFLGPMLSLGLGPMSGFTVPLDQDGNLRISYRKSPDTFRAISAVDIVEGNFEGSILDNGLVLVGATAFGLDDIVPTPYSGSTPGVELQARVIASILDSEVPYEPAGRSVILALVSVFLGGLLYFIASSRGRVALLGLPILAVASPIISLAFHGLILTGYGLWVGWAMPGLFGFLAGLILLVTELAIVRYERGRVMFNLHSYLPAETARKVALELPSSNIQAERRNVTLLCADLRNFSALGESRPPEESASVLHYFFTKVNSIVEQHGGRVHEYKGDSVLAIWDCDGADPAAMALAAALQIEGDVNDNLLPEIGMQGLEPLAVGIGIEQGPVLLGSIGPAHRRAHALCGETVSVTLRIQEMTADLASPILVGEVAARYLSDAKLESLGHFLLPGLVTTHVLFTPSSLHSSGRDNLTLLEGGLA